MDAVKYGKVKDIWADDVGVVAVQMADVVDGKEYTVLDIGYLVDMDEALSGDDAATVLHNEYEYQDRFYHIVSEYRDQVSRGVELYIVVEYDSDEFEETVEEGVLCAGYIKIMRECGCQFTIW
jgi:hypothetical protein